ncbi:hypothetical protein D3C81_1449410 [compost metagenome]
MGNGIVCERGLIKERTFARLTVDFNRSRSIYTPPTYIGSLHIIAVCRVSIQASLTMVASKVTKDNMVTGNQAGYGSSHFFNHSRTFMPKNSWSIVTYFLEAQISMADTYTFDANQNFIILWIFKFNIANSKRCISRFGHSSYSFYHFNFL